MGVTITTPATVDFPPAVSTTIVQIKRNWSSLWQTALPLIETSLSIESAGQGLSRLQFHRAYGSVKHTFQANFTTQLGPLNLVDWWVRVRALTPGATDLQTVWLGRVSSDAMELHAAPTFPAGVQQWTAFGPAQILRKRHIGRSWFDNVLEADEQEIGWIPPMNDPGGSEVGNRSDGTFSIPAYPSPLDVFVYGGDELWTYGDYLEYIIAKFLDESFTNGPAWRLGGQVDALYEMRTPISWGTTQTAHQMIRKLVPLDRGLDFTVRVLPSRTPSQGDDIPEEGFEIFVYPVSADGQVFAGFSLPANNSVVALDAGASADLHPSPRVVIDHDRKYDRIRLVGKRIIVCCSLWGAWAPAKAQVPDNTIGVPPRIGNNATSFPGSVKKWDDPIQTEYQTAAAASGDDEADHDKYRQQNKFDAVYASFGAPPDWDFNNGTAAPWCDDDGLLRVDDPDTEDEQEQVAPFQLWLRKTLPWLPFKNGEDWTKIASAATFARGEQTDVDDHHADYQPPIAWVNDPASYGYIRSTQLGISVRPKRDDWGLLLRASPNHILAENHWGAYKTAKPPRYDWEELILTIAFESDQRYTMEWAAEDATPKDGILEIPVDAELHYLAPNTAVASPWPGSTPAIVLSGNAGRVIREDRELMGLTMAGAIARYGKPRMRASVTIQGLVPIQDLVGQVLGTITESGRVTTVNGVVSGVVWNSPLDGSPTTILKAGNAS